ncbi:hypothetical protein FN846DRAFT_1002886, partial [Sphaerosporella brunnea]
LNPLLLLHLHLLLLLLLRQPLLLLPLLKPPQNLLDAQAHLALGLHGVDGSEGSDLGVGTGTILDVLDSVAAAAAVVVMVVVMVVVKIVAVNGRLRIGCVRRPFVGEEEGEGVLRRGGVHGVCR